MAHPVNRRQYGEPNHRQQMALERVEFALGELATVLLSHAQHDAAVAAIGSVRKAVAPIIADILTEEA